MAVRITVVVIQAAHRDGRMSDYEEQLLTRVMLENSLDAVFVGALEPMTAEGTDALCLSKIPANSIVLGWLSADAASAHFERLGMPWRVQRTDISAGPVVHYRQIRLDQAIDELMNSLLQALKNANLKTLQISLPTTAGQKASKPRVDLAPTAQVQLPKTPPALQSALQPATIDNVQPMRPFTQVSSRDDSQPDELDQLVDDLEALDL